MTRVEVDPARLPLLLTELRLPAIARLWPEIAERSDREGWPGARLLAVLAELEVAERARRRIERHLNEARLPPDKTLDNFDFNHVPMLSRARIMAMAAGDAWLDLNTDFEKAMAAQRLIRTYVALSTTALLAEVGEVRPRRYRGYYVARRCGRP